MPESTSSRLLWLRGDHLQVAMDTTAGPRLAVLSRPGGHNLLAELDDILVGPDDHRVRLRGGHRLWVAPETREVTYVPDDDPRPRVEAADGVMTATRESVPLALALTARLDGPKVVLDHRVTNVGSRPVQCAPWGITQFPLGGAAVLPYGTEPTDPDALQASGALTVWPYTDLGDTRLALHDGLASIAGAARRDGRPFKLGSDGRAGWLAHLHEDDAVIVRHRRASDAVHPDRDAAAQVYVDNRFQEVETTGPLVHLPPGGTTIHRVELHVHRRGELPRDLPDLAAVRC